MISAYTKDLFRTIRSSLGRFFAILAIVALGAGFYAGLQMASLDMKISANEYYDDTNLMDIKLISTLGFDDNSVSQLRNTDGVEGVMLGKSSDIVGNIDSDQCVIRTHSLQPEAYTQETTGKCCVKTPEESQDTSADEPAYKSANFDKDFINRLILTEGDWPQNSDECLLLADTVTSSEIKIGDTIAISECQEDVSTVFKHKEFKVTGFVQSATYVCTSNLGTTSIGGGRIQQVAYLPQSAYVDNFPSREAYVKVSGAKEVFANSEAYKDLIANATEAIEGVLPQISEQRTRDFKAEAQSKIDAAKSEYESGKSKAATELSSAKSQLDDALEKIQSGQIEYSEGATKLKNAEALLASTEQSTMSYLNETIAGLQALIAQASQLSGTFSSLTAGMDQTMQTLSGGYVSGQTESALTNFQSQLNQVNPLCQSVIALIQACPMDEAQKQQAIAGVQAYADLASTEASIVQATLNQLSQAPTPEAKAAVYNACFPNIAAVYGGMSQAQSLIKTMLDTMLASLNAGLSQAQAGLVEAQNQFAALWAELNQGKTLLESSKQQLDEGQSKYLDGKKSYDSAEAEANAKLSDALAKIQDGQSKVDSIPNAEMYLLDRTKTFSVAGYYSDSDRIANIAKVFPLFFFLVAALVVLTTMTRMVEEDRIVIGTYKALGYSRLKITNKYIMYGLIASVVGSIIGICILSVFLPMVVMVAYTIIYQNPVYATPINLEMALLSGGVNVLITIVATFFAANKTLMENPASLMLPLAPSPGKRILLERIKPLWSRLSFSWKVTLRNIFRYKKRLFMTLIGIAGCTALLLTGFGLHDSINDIIDKHFSYVATDNITISYDSNMSKENKAKLDAELNKAVSDQVLEDYTEVYEESILLTPPNANNAAGILIVLSDDKVRDFRQFKKRDENLYYRFNYDANAAGKVGVADFSANYMDGNTLVVSYGALLTEKTASLYQANVGDVISVSVQDSMGNESDTKYEVAIAGIVENYIGNYIYITADQYSEASGKPVNNNTVLCKSNKSAPEIQEFAKQLRDIEGVKTVVVNDEIISSYKNMLKSVDMVVVMLIAFAAMLAFIVLYNLININITERVRELATLKVLGFTRRETNMYIHKETIVMSMLGSALGLLFGMALESFVITSAEVDQVMFGRDIHVISFVFAFLITMIFTILVILFMRNKISNIDMVESLKSVD